MPEIIFDPHRTPTPTHTPTVESVMRKIGPVALQRATRALPEKHANHSWFGCFWAQMYGEPRELVRDSTREEKSFHQLISRRWGLTRQEFDIMWKTFDADYTHFRKTILDYLAKYDLKALEVAAECDRAIGQLFLQVTKEALEGIPWSDTSAEAAPEPNEVLIKETV